MCDGEVVCCVTCAGVEYVRGAVVRKGFASSAEHGLAPSYVMLRTHVRVDGVSVELSRASPKTVRGQNIASSQGLTTPCPSCPPVPSLVQASQDCVLYVYR